MLVQWIVAPPPLSPQIFINIAFRLPLVQIPWLAQIQFRIFKLIGQPFDFNLDILTLVAFQICESFKIKK